MAAIGDPTITPTDAADVCAQPWPSREEAIAQAMILRRAGWWVPIWDGHRGRYDGTVGGRDRLPP